MQGENSHRPALRSKNSQNPFPTLSMDFTLSQISELNIAKEDPGMNDESSAGSDLRQLSRDHAIILSLEACFAE